MDEEITWDDVNEYINGYRGYYGFECNLCIHFDPETDMCNKGHRVRRLDLDYGPNDHCYVRKKGGCSDFEKEVESKEERIKRIERSTRLALDCNFQQYC